MVCMNWESLEGEVRELLSPQRWAHVQGVTAGALELAGRFGAEPSLARLAALLHDAARDRPAEALRREVAGSGMRLDPLEAGSVELLHAPVGAWWARQRWSVTEGSVLEAVRYHTTGRPAPSLLEMVLMVADFTEPTRPFPQAQEVRQVARDDLLQAWAMTLAFRIRWLLEQASPLHPRTVAAYNWAVAKLGGGRVGYDG